MKKILLTAILALGVIFTSAYAEAREVKIVGSSTVFPYSQAVAEEFTMRAGAFRAPTVESTGTGGGMKIFCQGIGSNLPDITGASRAMKKSEWELCKRNGVTSITEVRFGYDGLSVANARRARSFDLTKAQLYLALAAKIPVDGGLVPNPYTKWSDVDPSLPNQDILVYGPPPTSGTRDAFVELVFHHVCKNDELHYWAQEKSTMDVAAFKRYYKAECTAMRTDGLFIEAGENDNLIVQHLIADPSALGIFGYSFLFENLDALQAVKVGGVEPSMETIGNDTYGISRPLFFYIKNAHRRAVPDLGRFVVQYVSEDAMGPLGYLTDRGLVPLSDNERDRARQSAVSGRHNLKW